MADDIDPLTPFVRDGAENEVRACAAKASLRERGVDDNLIRVIPSRAVRQCVQASPAAACR